MQDVLIPIETINRELESSLLIADHLAHRGHRVLIGSVRRINKMALALEGGVYLGAHAFYRRNHASVYRRMKQKGFALLYLHTEGGVYGGREESWKKALEWYLQPGESVNDLGPDDWHCTWGAFQAEYFRAIAPEALKPRIVVTGTPRFDLYKKRYRGYFHEEAKALREQHGPFVLVNTNLTYANNSRGAANTFSPALGYHAADPASRLWLAEGFEANMRTLGAIVHLVHRLSIEFPKLNFVLRPHPSEQADFYRSAFNGVPNIKVIHSGPVGAWLAAAEVLIHDGCTTAIEARLMDCPVISLGLGGNHKNEIIMANELGLRCTTQEEVIAQVSMVGREQLPLVPLRSDLAAVKMLHNFTANAVDALTDVVETALRERPGGSPISLRRLAFQEGLQVLRDAPKRLGARARSALSADTQHRKFYGLAGAGVRERYQRLNATAGLRTELHVLSDDLIALTPRGGDKA